MVKKKRRLCKNPLHSHKSLINKVVEERPRLGYAGDRLWFALSRRLKIAIQRSVGRVQNEMAIPAVAEMALDLILY
jgi:hypothetical protein